MKSIMLFGYLLFTCLLKAQQPLPSDYLSAAFHKERRETLRSLMPENSVLVVFANPERGYAADQLYIYHQNPDLYYLTGYNEPDAALVLFKNDQHDGDKTYHELFFVRKNDPLREAWTGRRLGVKGAKEKLGFENAFISDDFRDYPLDFSRFSAILYDALPEDIGPGTLRTLVNAFMQKANIQHRTSKNLIQSYAIINNVLTPSTLPRFASNIKSQMAATDDEIYKSDALLTELINHPDSATLAVVKEKVKSLRVPEQQYSGLLASLREIKTPEELSLIRKSAFISSIAHREVMKAVEPSFSESEIDGMFRFIHKKYGAETEGYPPIVGAGANSCILHYEENNVTHIGNQLLLMDVASEYHGYSADVTRTIPASGKFTPEQRAIYQVVYDAQEAVFLWCKEGTAFPMLNQKATETLADGMLRLGIIKDRKDISRYYIHGVSHHIGLDVHDKSIGRPLKENMVITVEPGIYIPEGSPCDPKWWNIGVRIEDDVIIKKDRCEIISAAAPRKAEEIEKVMAEKSIFNQLQLPELK